MVSWGRHDEMATRREVMDFLQPSLCDVETRLLFLMSGMSLAFSASVILLLT
jgi:hypothetical protein